MNYLLHEVKISVFPQNLNTLNNLKCRATKNVSCG